MSDERAQDQLIRYAQALDEIIKLGDYLWQHNGYVPSRGISRRIRDLIKQALGETMNRVEMIEKANKGLEALCNKRYERTPGFCPHPKEWHADEAAVAVEWILASFWASTEDDAEGQS